MDTDKKYLTWTQVKEEIEDNKMSYLGRGLEQVDNISKLDNITFNGGTTYALTKDSAAFTPISSNAILISIDGVVQQGNFSVSGTNIVFNFSPTSSNTW